MADQIVEVLVEIPLGSRNKYEYDHERHRFVLDRVLYASVHYPTDYGFIPGTLADDGDPLDALVLTTEPTFPGCLVPARPVGLLDMRDQKGEDQKVLAVSAVDPRYAEVRDLGDVAPHLLREIENFFQTYKTLEGYDTEITGWEPATAAWRAIQEAFEQARRTGG